MKKGEVWIVKMENEYDVSEFDRFMFPSLKDASKFLREYLPASGCFSGDIDGVGTYHAAAGDNVNLTVNNDR